MMGFCDGSGISWTICKQSAPRSTQRTTSTLHHSIFTGRMLFSMPNQQCESTYKLDYNNNDNDRLTAFDPGQPG